MGVAGGTIERSCYSPGTAKRPQAHLERRNTHLSWVKVRGPVRRARIPRVRILFMLYIGTFLYTIQAPKKPVTVQFWIFFGWRSIILPTIRFWGGYALDSKIEKWRMAALDVEQLCET